MSEVFTSIPHGRLKNRRELRTLGRPRTTTRGPRQMAYHGVMRYCEPFRSSALQLRMPHAVYADGSTLQG
jgi:hypothetical protein